MGGTTVLAGLRAICGTEYARAGGDADRVADVAPRWVASPSSTVDVSRLMRLATEHGLHVVARGSGTKLHWGAAPSAADLVLDMSRLTGVVEHEAGDLVAVVRAGTRIADLSAALAPADQRLAVDEMLPGATVGGAYATGAAGPLRVRYGTPRDQILGVTLVRPDGVVAHAGGKVVKNVAGYDLPRMLSGSYGTLGVFTELTVRLTPRPQSRVFVTRPVRTPAEVRELTTRVKDARLAPTAMEVECPVPENVGRGQAGRPVLRSGSLVLLLEGPAEGVAARARRAVDTLGGDTGVSDTAPDWWGRYPFGPDDVAVQVVTPVGHLFGPVYSIRDAAREIPVRVFCSPAAGVLHAAIPADAGTERVTAIVDTARAVAISHGGYCVVLSAPPRIRDDLDLWGPVEGVELMRAIKQQFDPDGRLAPGRYVGGI